ncbi:MAG: hypothetical protein M1823_006045 [Watsoniomyces obsoletus]|nr:MAG: hypothetical protein M1823_006045 [Watsoniomyces obsoletus]
MNDPGLDETIGKNFEAVEKNSGEKKDGRRESEEQVQDSRAPSSTGIPLVAGTFGPITSAFNLCALVQPWRVQIPPGGVEQHGFLVMIRIIAVNAVSLVVALVANIALLLNMARRISSAVAQPIIIIGWYVASFLLLALVITAPTRLRPPFDHAFTQAYYYALMATALYFIIASLMLITLYGAWKGYHQREFNLTKSQRTLMLQTIVFLAYLLLGALVYSRIEGWEYLHSVYWADVTLLTIGFGYPAPVTHLGRSLIFPFIIGGLVYIGLVIGSVRSLVLERGKQRMEIRLVEKNRQRAVSGLEDHDGKVQLGWFASRRLPKAHTGREDRLRQEFRLMRSLQEVASRNRRWMSLGISVLVWLALWLSGAAVFWEAERDQDWTYFESIYFTFIALTTTGYGDYQPLGNAARAFFVFWSLLAVPTVTVVVSNMGDTVVKAIKDATLRVGEWTLLPGEQGVRAGFKQSVSTLMRDSNPSDVEADIQMRGQRRLDGKDKPTKMPDSEGVKGLTKEVGETEEKEAQAADERGDSIGRDIHHHLALLMKAMREAMEHLDESPPKEYTYDEWMWYLKLIEVDVESSVGKKEKNVEDEKSSSSDSRGGSSSWNWLSPDSPLMSNLSETRWVLDHLARTLEKKLKELKEPESEKKDGSGPS